MAQADNLQYVKDRIKEFLLLPASLSKKTKAGIRVGFDSHDVVMTTKMAAKILDNISVVEPELAEKLKGYTRHKTCQTSLIRDVLLEIWNMGELNTQPISVIGALPASRLASSGAMA